MIDYRLIELIILISLSSIGIAIALKQKYNNKKYNPVILSIYFNLFIGLSVFIASIFSEDMISIVSNNMSLTMTMIGMIAICTGFKFIEEFKNKMPENVIVIKIPSLKRKIRNNLALPILLIYSYLAILTNIIYVAPIIWMNIFELGVICSISSLFSIIAIYLIINNYIKVPKNAYSGIYGIFLILSGVFYIAIYVFIPAFKTVLQNKMNVLTLPEPLMMLFIIAISLIVIVIGFILKKSGRFNDFI
jgi:predicted transporter